MVTLKIRQKGFFIELPGVAPFRTPADVNITHVSIPLIVTTLKSLGIEKFEITSDTPGKEQRLTEKNFAEPKIKKDKLNGRLDNLEKMVKKLLSKNTSEPPSNKEQITDKLERLEVLSQAILEKSTSVYVPSKKKEPTVEEMDTFIPEIDIGNVKLKGSSGKEVIKKDEDDTDESADLLSNLTGGRK